MYYDARQWQYIYKLMLIKMTRAISIKSCSTLFFVLFACSQSFAQPGTAETCICDMMQQSDVVGISVAVVKKNKIIYTHSFGWKESAAKTPLTDD
ncbi:MAG: hypothetical protein ABI675_02335 [Chitinophagaceae bacterium]